MGNMLENLKERILFPLNSIVKFLEQYTDAVTLIFILFLLTGVCLLTMSILLSREEKRRTVLNKIAYKKNTERSFVDDILNRISIVERFESKIEERVKILDKEMTSRKITKLILVSDIAGIIFGILINNAAAIIPLLAIGYYVPIIIIDIKSKKKKKLLEEQFGNAIKLFVTEFTTNKSVLMALNNISDKVKNPLKNEFEKLLLNLNSGEHYKESFMDFAHRLDNKWAYIFSKLIISYLDKGSDFTTHLIRITEQINEEKIRYKESSTELTALKMTNLIINAAIPVVYFINKWLSPEQARVFVETDTGKSIMLFVIVGSFVSLVLGLKIEEL